MLARIRPFDWSYEFTVNYDPWGQTPLGPRGSALAFSSPSIVFEEEPGVAGPSPRMSGPLAVAVIEGQLEQAGLIPPGGG